MSYATTTKLRVLRGAPRHESSGDMLPPGAPLTVQGLAVAPVGTKLSTMLSGIRPPLTKVALRTVSRKSSSPAGAAPPLARVTAAATASRPRCQRRTAKGYFMVLFSATRVRRAGTARAGESAATLPRRDPTARSAEASRELSRRDFGGS